MGSLGEAPKLCQFSGEGVFRELQAHSISPLVMAKPLFFTVATIVRLLVFKGKQGRNRTRKKVKKTNKQKQNPKTLHKAVIYNIELFSLNKASPIVSNIWVISKVPKKLM